MHTLFGPPFFCWLYSVHFCVRHGSDSKLWAPCLDGHFALRRSPPLSIPLPIFQDPLPPSVRGERELKVGEEGAFHPLTTRGRPGMDVKGQEAPSITQCLFLRAGIEGGGRGHKVRRSLCCAGTDREKKGKGMRILAKRPDTKR